MLLKTHLTFLLCTAFALNIFAQDDLSLNSDNNYLDRSDLYILKPNSDANSIKKISVSEINSLKEVELLFGSYYKINKFPAVFSAEGFTRIEYSDGLMINLPEYAKTGLGFEITSDKYTIILSGGQIIKVGMKGDELQKIFPKAYSKRIIATNPSPERGKTFLRVYFSSVHNNKSVIEGNSIVFVLTKEDNSLEQIRTSYPD